MSLTVSNQAPAWLHSAEWLPNGQFQFVVAGEPGPRYAVEISEDLVHWTAAASAPTTNASPAIFDPAAGGFNRRFYRAITLP